MVLVLLAFMLFYSQLATHSSPCRALFTWVHPPEVELNQGQSQNFNNTFYTPIMWMFKNHLETNSLTHSLKIRGTLNNGSWNHMLFIKSTLWWSLSKFSGKTHTLIKRFATTDLSHRYMRYNMSPWVGCFRVNPKFHTQKLALFILITEFALVSNIELT